MVAVPVIASNGNALPDTFELLSVEVVRETNRVPYARLVFADGDIANAAFPALDSEALAPGAEIEIKVRIGDAITPLFKGLAVRLALELADGRPRLAVECKDKAWRLTTPRRSAIYTDGTDADAIGTILRRAGIEIGDLALGGGTQQSLVQYDASDWDFIVSRAEARGAAVVAADGVVSVPKLALGGASVIGLQLGIDDIEDFELELDAGGQNPDLGAIGWDLPRGGVTEPALGEPLALTQGDLDPATVGRDLGLSEATLRHLAPLPVGELKAWASARLARSRLAMLRGRIALGGTGAVSPMDLIDLVGFGARFDGTALVTAVRHTLEDGGWRSDLRLGLSPELFGTKPDIPAPPAQGLLPAARGLTIGIVSGYSEDPDGEYRVRLMLPGMAGGDDSLWARLAAPEAGNERGFFFRPDPGDEVVVGFLADDPRQPVVLGALFGSKNRPPPAFADLSDDNVFKGLATRHGMAVAFTDRSGKAVLSVKTPQGTLTIDDDKGQVSLRDGNDNSLVMDKNGITITAAKDLTVEAGGKIVLKGASIDAN